MARVSALARTIELARARVDDDRPLLEKCRARGGDARAQLRARRAFLNRGHFSELAATLAAEALAREDDDDGEGEGEGEEASMTDDAMRVDGRADEPTSPRAKKLAKKRAERRRRRREKAGVDAEGVAATVVNHR